MSLDDDVFSPIRFDTTVDSSKNSDGSFSNLSDLCLGISFTDVVKDKHSLKDNAVKSRRQKEQSKHQNVTAKYSEFGNTDAPISNIKSSASLNTKKLSSSFTKLNVEKKKDLKNVLRLENAKCHQMEQEIRESLQKANRRSRDPVCQAPNSDSSKQVDLKKISRPTSLLPSKDEVAKYNLLKDAKKRQKSVSESSKNIYNQDEANKKSTKLSSDKKLIENSLRHLKSRGSSVTSTESEGRASVCVSLNEKPNNTSERIENPVLAPNAVHPQYEGSIERIIQYCISSETAKIRQNMYMQQLSFCRQMNKIKVEMEQQHTATTERLFKVIEELMQMNATLKSMLVDKT